MSKYVNPPERMTLTVRLTQTLNSSAEEIDEIWAAEIDTPDEPWTDPEGWADALIESLAAGAEFPPEHVYKEETVSIDWGASAGVRNFLIDVAVNTILANLAWDLLKIAVKKAASTRVEGKDLGYMQMPPSRDEVVNTAKWRVEVSFMADYESLEEVSVEELPGEAWRIELRDAGHNYEVDYELPDGFLSLARVRRSAR